VKSGKASNPNITQLTPLEATVLEHVANYGLTTRDVWQDGDLANTDIASVCAAASSLTRSGLLEVGNLYHGRHYFVLTHRGIDQVKHSTVRPGLLSESFCRCWSVSQSTRRCLFQENNLSQWLNTPTTLSSKSRKNIG